jgi:hypothetical protein
MVVWAFIELTLNIAHATMPKDARIGAGLFHSKTLNQRPP